jgi:drug/metabolite transporter (DMT)-like permease
MPAGKTMLVMSLNALLGNVITNYLMAVAVVILGPVLVAVGLTLQVLMAAFVDHFKDHLNFGIHEFASIILVIAAVVLVALAQPESESKCTADEESGVAQVT